ncbi:MAG: GTP cyclohydrolase I FolE [Bacteroidales bacterium]|nr:GTP cyclohydrolase I FolE [Bacteroidales bacterium]
MNYNKDAQEEGYKNPYYDPDDSNNIGGYERIEHYNPERIEKLKPHYKEILGLIGENPEREGLIDTPKRVAKAMQYLTHGYDLDPEKILKSAMFQEEYKQMVVVKDIEIYSLCEHHMIPFIGKAHVAYIPNGYIVGLSKIPRVVDAYARRLQVQERLTMQIKDAIQNTLKPLGVAVVIEAKHLCMAMRGIQKQNSVTTTSDFTGAFTIDKTRQEFLHLIDADLA